MIERLNRWARGNTLVALIVATVLLALAWWRLGGPKATVVWKSDLGPDGLTSALAANADQVFALRQVWQPKAGALRCLSMATGELQWEAPLPDVHDFADLYATDSLVVLELPGGVYQGHGVRDGTMMWEYADPGGVVHSALCGDWLVLGLGAPAECAVVGVNVETGEEAWRIAGGRRVAEPLAQPALRSVIVGDEERLVRIDAASGAVLAESSPGTSGQMTALGKSLYCLSDGLMRSLDGESLAVRWERPSDAYWFATPLSDGPGPALVVGK